MIGFFLWVTEALTTWISGSLVAILFFCVLRQLIKWTEYGQVMNCYIYLWLSHLPLSNTSMLWRVSSSGTDWSLYSRSLYSFVSPHHFSIQMQMPLSHTVPEHSVSLSSPIFPHGIVFAGSIVLVTGTNQANFHLIAYTGSWDSITSVSSSLVALLVLSTWFFICLWYLCSPSETSEFKDTNSLFCSSYVDRGLLRTKPSSEVLSGSP